jgi:hypothetical protein
MLDYNHNLQLGMANIIEKNHLLKSRRTARKLPIFLLGGGTSVRKVWLHEYLRVSLARIW